MRSEVSVGANLVKRVEESSSMREYEAKTAGQNGHWPKRQFVSGDSNKDKTQRWAGAVCCWAL